MSDSAGFSAGRVSATRKSLCASYPLVAPSVAVRRAAPRARTRPAQPVATASTPRRWISQLAVPAVLVLACFVVFLPALQAGFVNWDDDQNFLDNPNYRGLGTPQLRWMFTTFLMAHYIPLTWMTLGLDYAIWGMNPVGYHLTNLLLHAANAVLFYFMALRLLRAGLPDLSTDGSLALTLGSGFATLLFAVHPLRVESVAWITERRDVLSGMLYLAAIVAYLRYCDGVLPEGNPTRRTHRWYWASLGLFGLALLSKSMAVTLPVILLVLDTYPLRRIGGRRLWASARSAVTEKLPFFLLSLAAGITALVALEHGAHIPSGAEANGAHIPSGTDAKAGGGLLDQVAISAYALAFYLWKIAVPVALSARYELPPRSGFEAWPAFLSGAVVLVVTAAAIIGCRRWPALGAVWVGYIVILSPVVWVPDIAADRYTYLACAGWALLGGAGLSSGWSAWQERKIDTAIAVPLAGLAVSVVAALGILTWNQAKVWHDSETLWTHAVAARPSSLGHFKLGVTLAHQGDFTKAIENFHAALRINPRYAAAHSALGFTFAVQGRLTEAREQFDQALRISPREAEAHTGLGLLLARQDKLGEAADHFRRALEISSRDTQAHTNLGLILKKEGKWSEAAAHFQAAVRIDPGSGQAQHQWGLVLAEQGKLGEAIEHLREAVRIDPRYAEAHRSLGEVLLRQGRAIEAAEHLEEARRLRP
jgi:protein O-mannosyl-transferase